MDALRHTHSYRWWLIVAVLVACGTALGACRSEDPVSSDADRGNGKPSSISADPDPTYYEADVHVAVHGGGRRGAALEHSYHIVRALRDGAWSTELSNPAPESPAGARSGNGIARITLTGNPWHMTITTRSGRVLTPSDLPAATAGIGKVRPDAAWTSGVGASLGVQRAPLTRDVVGSAGRAHLLARYTAPEYSERPGLAGRRRFERAQGARRMTVEVDPVTGAAVREELREDGRVVVTTSRSYHQAGPLVLLDREVTTQFDTAGAPRMIVERRLTNIRTERSR